MSFTVEMPKSSKILLVGITTLILGAIVFSITFYPSEPLTNSGKLIFYSCLLIVTKIVYGFVRAKITLTDTDFLLQRSLGVQKIPLAEVEQLTVLYLKGPRVQEEYLFFEFQTKVNKISYYLGGYTDKENLDEMIKIIPQSVRVKIKKKNLLRRTHTSDIRGLALMLFL